MFLVLHYVSFKLTWTCGDHPGHPPRNLLSVKVPFLLILVQTQSSRSTNLLRSSRNASRQRRKPKRSEEQEVTTLGCNASLGDCKCTLARAGPHHCAALRLQVQHSQQLELWHHLSNAKCGSSTLTLADEYSYSRGKIQITELPKLPNQHKNYTKLIKQCRLLVILLASL